MQAKKDYTNKEFQAQKLPGDAFCLVTVAQMLNLAEQATAATQYYVAGHQLKQLANAFPKMPEAKLKLLELAVLTGNGEMADSLVAELEKLRVKRADLLPLLVERALKSGDAATALECVQKLMQLTPNSAKAYFILGQVHTALGDKELAIAAYDAVIARDPRHARPFYFRGLLLKQHLSNKQRQQLDDALAFAQNTDVDSFAHLHLAKAWSHYGDVDEEFRHLDIAKQKMATGAGWSADLFWSNFQEIANFSDKHRLRTAQAIHNSDDAPVFIIGMGRSGTTLLESILSAHRDFMATGERGMISQACDQVGLSIGKDGAFWQWGAHFKLDELLAKLHQRISQHDSIKAAAGRRWIDKSLRSFNHVGLIKMVYPKAKFIHIRRNPMAVCLSNYQHWMGAGNFVPLTLEQLAQNYQLIDRGVAHWKTLFPDDILSMDFKSLTSDFEGEVRKILAFLGAEWDEACLKFNEQKSVILTPSAMQVRAAINQDSEMRWLKYEKYLQPVARILKL